MTIAESTRPVTGGVDTHANVHVAAAVDGNGGVLGVESFATTPARFAELPARGLRRRRTHRRDLVVAAGDNPYGPKSEAFAHLCGVAPLPCTTGKTHKRFRLNPGGNRQANNALWRIVFTRMSSDERTRKYGARRLTEGRSTREIMRALKRYVARELDPHRERVPRSNPD